MKITKGQLRRIIREEAEKTIKHNANPALKGDQTKLPDELQKAIIDKEEEKDKVKEAVLQRIMREALLSEQQEPIQFVDPGVDTAEFENKLANYAHVGDIKGALADPDPCQVVSALEEPNAIVSPLHAAQQQGLL